MFRVGIVGTGIIGASHIKAILKNDEICVGAVCDIDAAKAQEAAALTNAATYTDYKEMAEKESLDCVILNLPHFLHKDVTVYFLNKKIPVLVEKPMANTVGECEEMIEASQSNDTPLAIGHVQKYFECYRNLKAIIEEESLGKLCSITETRNIDYFTPQRPKWFLNKSTAGGGIVMNYCAHTMDKIIYATGLKATEIHAIGNNFLTDDDVEATAQVLVKFENGVTAAFTYCGTHVPTQYDTYFYFTNGTAYIEAGGEKLHIRRLGQPEEITEFDISDLFERQIAQLVKFLKGEENELVTPEIGKQIIAVNEQIVNMI